MSIKDYNELICTGVDFSAICDDRFKTARISFNMILPLEYEIASMNAILPMLLRRSSKKYNTFQKINNILSELYGAVIYADVKKIGEAQLLNLTASFTDERYLPSDSNLSLKICDLLCELIFRPNITDGGFSGEDVQQEKRQLIETLKSEFNDKRAYSKRRCEEIMCENEKFSINILGTQQLIEQIAPKSMLKHWKYVLENAKINIIMLGSGNYDKIKEKFKNEFSTIDRKEPLKPNTEIIKKADNVKTFTENYDIKQAKLVMGFRTKRSIYDDNVMATRVMSALFGGTPHSKLFSVVREKMSLCYYCSSMFYRNKGVMFVQSGIEEKNIKKAQEAILQQLEELKQGNFTQSEIDATKLSIVNSFNAFTDSIAGLESWYISQLFEPTPKTIAETIEEINYVTKNDIIDAAKDVSLDTIFALVSEDYKEV